MEVEVRIAIKQQCSKRHEVESKPYFTLAEVSDDFKTWALQLLNLDKQNSRKSALGHMFVNKKTKQNKIPWLLLLPRYQDAPKGPRRYSQFTSLAKRKKIAPSVSDSTSLRQSASFSRMCFR